MADDGTADLNPRLMELAGGNAVCMWQDSNAQLGDEADLTTFNSHLEISVATYDSASGTWSAASRLTNDSVVDRSPNLAAAAQNDMLAVWVSNAANDTWGSATAPNTIMWSAWDGTAWSTPAAMATDMGTILDTVLAYNGTTGTFICVLDPDDTSTRRRTRSCGWPTIRVERGPHWPAYKQFRRGCSTTSGLRRVGGAVAGVGSTAMISGLRPAQTWPTQVWLLHPANPWAARTLIWSWEHIAKLHCLE